MSCRKDNFLFITNYEQTVGAAPSDFKEVTEIPLGATVMLHSLGTSALAWQEYIKPKLL